MATGDYSPEKAGVGGNDQNRHGISIVSPSVRRHTIPKPCASSSHFAPCTGTTTFGLTAAANSRRSDGEAWPLV